LRSSHVADALRGLGESGAGCIARWALSVFANADLFVAATTASLGVTGRGEEQAGATRTATAAMTGQNAVETTS
jgi:hypothetical protein